MKHELPKLPYEYNALEPHIDEATMRIHHTKHHQTYIDKLNSALEKYPDFQIKSVEELVRDVASLPKDLQSFVSKHGGGHYNHSLFWNMMSPQKNQKPMNGLLNAINASFGSFDMFKEAFTNEAANIFGSGWAWLIVDEGILKIVSTANQDNPIMRGGNAPILGLDVWEHAYYLKYQNKRGEYIQNWFSVVNWDFVAKQYTLINKK